MSPWLRAVQILCTFGLALFLWRSVDWAHFVALLMDLRWSFIALAAAALLVAHIVNILRWRLLVLPDRVALAAILSYYGAGIFSNNFLPTGIGGDGVRVALIRRHTTLRRAVWSVAADRALGLIGLLSFGLPGLWLGPPPMIVGALRSLSAAQAALAAAAALLAGLGLSVAWRRVPAVRARAAAALRQIFPVDASAGGRSWLRAILGAYLLSLGASLCMILSLACTLLAFDLPLVAGAAIWPVLIGSLSLLVPVTVNGLGVMESVFVLILGFYGVPAPGALGVALCTRGLMIGFSLLGGLASLGQGWAVAARPGEPRP